MMTCSCSSLPLKYLKLSTNYHHPLENTTNSEDIYTVAMVSKITRIKIVIAPSLRPSCLSALHAAHQGTSAMASKVEASIFWPGITSESKPPEPIAHTATGWPHHRQHYHPHLPPYWSTHFSAYVQTTFTTKAALTLSSLIDIPTGL